MARTLLQRWLAHYDPIHRGWTLAGIANGVCATNGFSFSRIRGGYNLRRDEDALPNATFRIVGAAGADTETIRTFPWVSHSAETSYVYQLTAINGGGVENVSDATTARVDFDASGQWSGLRPNSVTDLRVGPVSDGRFRLQWIYTAEGQQAEPSEFRIYHDAGSGTVDFQTIVATVADHVGRYHHSYTSESFAHGTRLKFAVRAASAEGVEEDNANVVFGWADAVAPPINPGVMVHVRDF
jgi:hypothetical protein